MYCYVIFGESEDNHTRCYLYECPKGIKPGDIVKVPTNNKSKNALVKVVFEMIPDKLSIDSSRIRSVGTKSRECVDEKTVKSYLLSLIDEYKDEQISKENFYTIMEHMVSTNELIIRSSDMEDIIKQQLPDACLFYIEEPGDPDKKELCFWKELKDIENKLRYV